MTIRHVIVDRDGVLNQEPTDSLYVRGPSEFRWLPGVLEGLGLLRQANVRVSVATNQSCVGRGLMTEDALRAVHLRMQEDARAAGGCIDEIVCCIHTPETGCECRKPAPGLVRTALARSIIAAKDTVLLGDDRRDLEAGWRSGVRVALVRTGKGRSTESQLRGLGVDTYDDFVSFAKSVVHGAAANAEACHIDPLRIFDEHARVLAQTSELLSTTIHDIVAVVHCGLQGGSKLFACGNGGSASDAQHLVAELVGRFQDDRRPLPAFFLGGDPASLTAIANDFGYDQVFARQLQALGTRGDILFAFSTSGNSANVVQAVLSARRAGCTIVAMTGGDGGQIAKLADILLCVPSTVVARIQEMHALIIHVLCEALDTLIRQSEGA